MTSNVEACTGAVPESVVDEARAALRATEIELAQAQGRRLAEVALKLAVSR